MELRKSGFTLAEFMISITAMLIVMAAALPVAFNKVKTDRKNVARIDGEIYCGCLKNHSGKIGHDSYGVCEFEITAKQKAEFVHVRLVGGGGDVRSTCDGASTTCKGGTAGEIKNVVIPYMQGKYRIKLGEGGHEGQNGKPTALYRVFKNDEGEVTEELLASAAGGISTNEGVEPGFEADRYGEVTETGCGNGSPEQNFIADKENKGEVHITW